MVRPRSALICRLNTVILPFVAASVALPVVYRVEGRLVWRRAWVEAFEDEFIRYAERSAGLLNAEITDVDALQAFLADREWLVHQCTDRDCMLLRRFQQR